VRWIALFLLLVLGGTASAQLAGENGGGSGNGIGPGSYRSSHKGSVFMGLAGGTGTTGPGPTPCLAGQLDFSLATGCNVSFYVLGVS